MVRCSLSLACWTHARKLMAVSAADAFVCTSVLRRVAHPFARSPVAALPGSLAVHSICLTHLTGYVTCRYFLLRCGPARSHSAA